MCLLKILTRRGFVQRKTETAKQALKNSVIGDSDDGAEEEEEKASSDETKRKTKTRVKRKNNPSGNF